ncbi:MAG: class I SAM-dependent methyltransferase [Phycisphaerae bacterium]|nr:class I SAM-dependent methyltransferase [Phycisphaerae bacterium]
MERLDACLVCGHRSTDAKDRYARRDDVVVACPECGLLYANPQYTPEELVGLYKRDYYDEGDTLEGTFRSEEHTANRVLYQTVLRDLFRRYPRLGEPADGRARRVLDYGCGPGYFLAECREAGFEPTGIEFSRIAARYAEERLGVRVLVDPDSALGELPDAHYDLVTAWAVIEHTRRPRDVLGRLVAKLVPGGVLCLTLPNLRCWRYLLERGRWFNIANPTHLVFFSEGGIRRLLAELGMGRIVRPVFWGGRPGFGFSANLLQYCVRVAGLGSDLRLYAERPCSKG